MTQPDLFGNPSEPDPPAQRHSATSVAAASAAKEFAPLLRNKLLALLQRVGAYGLTDEEMQRELAMDANTQRPRRRELEQAGMVRDSGKTRETRSGRRATVWVVCE